MTWHGKRRQVAIDWARAPGAALALGIFGLLAYLSGVQGGGPGDFIPRLAAVALLGPVVSVALARQTGFRVLLAALLVNTGGAALHAGSAEQTRAFNECVERVKRFGRRWRATAKLPADIPAR